MENLRTAMRWLLAGLMVAAGISHFKTPAPFVAIVPDWLSHPEALVSISGFFEGVGGLGLLIPFVRKFAGWGLIALYLAVLPANVNMAVHHLPLGGKPVADWILWGRLPLQFVLIAWAKWCSSVPRAHP